MNAEQAGIIERMGFDAENNAAFVGWMDEAIRNAQIADRAEGIAWFLGEGWP